MEIRKPKKSDGEDTREVSQKSWIEGFKEILTDKELQNSRNPEHFYDEERFQEDQKNDKMVNLVAEEDGKSSVKSRYTGMLRIQSHG